MIMDRALDLGINFFDTANRYGGPKGPGATETIVGNWFAQGGGRREKVVLATKVFGPMSEWPNDGGLSARHIRDACEASLRRLQTDHIDLYQMHHVDRNAPWDEVWQAMETLVDAGQGDLRRQQQLRGLAHRAGERGRGQAQLPRARQRAEPLQPRGRARSSSKCCPRAAATASRVIPWSPLAGGMLGGKVGARRHRAAQERRTRVGTRCAPQLETVGEALCRARRGAGRGGARVVAAAPAEVTAPIIGPRTLEQLEGASLRATRDRPRRRRAEGARRDLPGPGGRAPEAYAW